MSKHLVLFCSNYRLEIENLNLSASYDNIETSFFPSHCGSCPVNWEEFKNKLPGDKSYEKMHIISCGCITGLPEANLIADTCNNRYLKQCFHAIVNPELADYFAHKGYYLVTPGWLRQWRNIIGEWGFDQPTAREFFKESARAILLLDTGVDSEALTNLADFAAYTDRPMESVTVGLDYLNLLLDNTILKSSIQKNNSAAKEAGAKNRKELADFAMALDLLNSMARAHKEETVVRQIREMFMMLFAPRDVIFRSIAEDIETTGKNRIADIGKDGFIIPVFGSEGRVGEIEVQGLQLPEHREQYKTLAFKIVNICGLAIENARRYKQVKDLSDTDGLTGIANRRKLEKHLEYEWKRLQRDKAPLSLLMIDVDNFKNFNDLYGHQAGDNCLKAIAAVLKSRCQRTGDLATRYGGEEFTLILPGTERDGAIKLAEMLREAVEKLQIRHEDSSVGKYVTVSIGVASATPSPESPAQNLVALADIAMYKAKTTGRNKVEAS